MTLTYKWPDDATTRWPNFSIAEMQCKCGCGTLPEPRFMEALQAVRLATDFPLLITSGARCSAYNRQVSSTGLVGPHTTGLAADVAVSGKAAHALLDAALAEGFSGIGVKQSGPHASRFIHLDLLDAPNRPWVWSYH